MRVRDLNTKKSVLERPALISLRSIFRDVDKIATFRAIGFVIITRKLI